MTEKLRGPMRFIISIALLFFMGIKSMGQTVPTGFPFQTSVRDATGKLLPLKSISLRFSFLSGTPSGPVEWEEKHELQTDAYGHLKAIIGKGISTGTGTVNTFDLLNWGKKMYYISIAMDMNGGNNFVNIGTEQLFSVPYAFYSRETGSLSGLTLSQLTDTKITVKNPDEVLKWSGTSWLSQKDMDSDTVSFAYTTDHSAIADTAFYAVVDKKLDTALFAHISLNSNFSGNSANSTNTYTAMHADTAKYALMSAPVAWTTTGNALKNNKKMLGTIDSTSFTWKSSNTVCLKHTAAGHVLFGNADDNSGCSVFTNDGLLVTGSGIGLQASPGAGTRLVWGPVKGSFRAGRVSGNQWDSINIGGYSFACGYNVTARDYAFTLGNESTGGDYTVSLGRKAAATALGAYPAGSGVAIGDSSLAPGQRCVVIGRGNYANAAANVVIGFNSKASGGVSTALGSYCNANGSYSTAMGYYAHTNAKIGSFIYSDASSTTYALSTAHSQFKVRASGGITFYTDPGLTMAVTLAPGSGSWSTVSDIRKKENVKAVDTEFILSQIEKTKIRSWNYKTQQHSIRHIGPFAQDFYQRFKVGESALSITSADADGVILSGIKGIDRRLDQLKLPENIEYIEHSVLDLNVFQELNDRLSEIEKQLLKETDQ